MTKKVTFFLVVMLVSFAALQAQTWTQIGADIDGEAAFDWSGWSVSLSSDGSVVAIGAIVNEDEAGHVRVYKNTSGTWTQVGSDIDGDAAGDESGYSVSLSSDGSIVAIGAPGSAAGYVRVYKNISGTWTQIGIDIDGEAAGDYSGHSVSLSSDGSVVAIGAIWNGGNGIDAGQVRVYKNLSGTWTQVGADIDGETAGDKSGHSVSLSSDGSIVAIGAIENNGSGIGAGHVRVYKNMSGTWTQIGADIDGEATGDDSGCSVSLNSDGSIVAIGASDNDGNGTNSGHVRVYKNMSGAWIQIGADIDGEAAYDYSGFAVSLSGDGSVVAIGAPENAENAVEAGHVRVYKNISGTWTQLGADINGEAADDYSGCSVSLSSDGSIVAIGAMWNAGSYVDAGHVRVYEFVDPSVSIADQLASQNGISIYPNPTSGIIYFDFAENNIQKIIISDVTGKVISEKLVSQQQDDIDLSNHSNGIYIIEIYTDNNVFSSKIIKE